MRSLKFAQLDALIVMSIEHGNAEFHRICGGAVRVEAEQHSRTDAWRVVDRRLQALRKKGVIRFDKKAWSVVQQEPPCAA